MGQMRAPPHEKKLEITLTMIFFIQLALASRMRPRPLVLGVVVGDDGDEVDRETGQLRDDPLRAALVRRTLHSLGGLDHHRILIKVTGVLFLGI